MRTEKCPEHTLRAWLLNIKGGVHIVYIFLIQLLPKELDRFTEPLEVNHFPFPEEFDHIIYIRIITKTKDVVVSDPGLLLWERIA